MSAEETRAEHPEEKSIRRQRLKLIDIYTNRGAFRGDELRGIAERAREITMSRPSSVPLPDTEERLAFGEPSGESSGGAIGELSGEQQNAQSAYPIENANRSATNQLVSSSTVPFIDPPHDSPDRSPDSSPYDSPKQTPHSIPHNPPSHSPSVPLTENQAILYFCLKQLNGEATNLSRISQATGISEHTLKSCLKKLRQEGLIQHGGRQQFKGMTGFSATVVLQDISLQGDEYRFSRRLQQIVYNALPLTARLTPLDPNSQPLESSHPTIHLTDHQTAYPTTHPTIDQTGNALCSSNKELLLQTLVLEGAFLDLNPRSLVPYLHQFDTAEELQNFLDIADAYILAAKEGHGKPIHNPHGFLFAQLRAGYINPPEGYKSRKIRAQEYRNQQLEEELATLRGLKEREQELRFELFVAQLTEEDLARLEREAQVEVKPNIGLTAAFQMDMHKDIILKQWFTQRWQLQQERSGHP